jgi:hypothetical protein
MIYFLHIKTTPNLDCKYFFNTVDELNRFLRKKLPMKIIEKYMDKRFVTVHGKEIEEEFENEKVIQGRELETYLEKKIDIQCIDEEKVKDYEKLFKCEFFYSKKKEEKNEQD